MTDILDKLRGGDLRSIGNANEIAREIATNPELFKIVFNGLYSDDAVVRMRSADAVEKASKERPEILAGYSSKVLSILASVEQQEVCWHMAQISPRLDLTNSEGRQIIELLKRLLSHKSKIARVSAMDAMASFAERDETIVDEVKEIIKTQMESGIPSILSRGRKLLQRLERKETNA
jgi:HEAT repeat protein